MKRNQTKNKIRSQAGFTLIELLVVISIVGLISSIALTSMSAARKKGRDAKRVSDIKQINTAIQFFINDFGRAPYAGAMNCSATNPAPSSDCGSITETQPAEWTALQTDLSPYLQRLPKDPCGAACYIANPPTFYSYVYHPPSAIKNACASGCSLSNSQFNLMYNIFADHMEVSSPNFVFVNNGFPTYGIKGHNVTLNSF